MTRNDKEGSRQYRVKPWVVIVMLSPIFYLSMCTYISTEHSHAFDSIQVGDNRAKVLSRFGSPSVSEKKDDSFVRYSSIGCTAPCEERLWFENKMILGVEAWSIDLGVDGRVVHKAHWSSP